jgi:hypothetical protein
MDRIGVRVSHIYISLLNFTRTRSIIDPYVDARVVKKRGQLELVDKVINHYSQQVFNNNFQQAINLQLKA